MDNIFIIEDIIVSACIKQKCAATGVRLLRWDTICLMKHYYKVRVPKNEYIQNIISSVDLKEDVVYSFLKESNSTVDSNIM